MKRAHVRVDRFAVFHVADEHALSSSALHLLHALVLLVDWRTGGEWRGTLGELHEDTHMMARTLVRAFDELSDAGIVDVMSPFAPNRDGVVRLVIYDRLVVLTGSQHAPNDASAEDDTRAPFASDSRSTRAQSAPNDASDQGKHASGRNKATKEQGREDQSRDNCCAAHGITDCLDCDPIEDVHEHWIDYFEHNFGAAVIVDIDPTGRVSG